MKSVPGAVATGWFARMVDFGVEDACLRKASYRTASGSERDQDASCAVNKASTERIEKLSLYPARYRSRFCTEHDDHHLARISELRRLFAG